MDSRFDDILHTVIVQKGQGIHGFLDVIMGFLYRRTDFFYEMAPNENMGFFPNQAESLVYGFFRKYQNMHFKERVPKRNIDPKEIEEFMKKQKEKKEEKAPLNTLEKPKIVEIKENQIGSTPTVEKKEINEEPIVRTNPPEEERKNVESLNINSTNDKKIDPKYSSISTHNGDSCDMYNWSQGTNDVSVQIYLLENTSANKIKVDMTSSSITVKYKEKPSETYFTGEFCEKIDPSESYWTIEDGKYLNLFLDKAQELIWKSAFKGHKEIDTKKVDNSKKLEEFDNDTQAALNKIIYEQNRKKNGLPTTEEEKKLEALKEAWNKPDSPFKGQPFDPSMFNLNEPIYYNTPDYEAKLRMKKEQEELNKTKK